jgi:predicted Rossmann-fold nucleotide-binding protein
VCVLRFPARQRRPYAEVAREVGHWIGSRGGQLVYGGGRSGLMGIVADSALAAGGTVVGIIPQALVDRELAHNRSCLSSRPCTNANA